MKRNRKAPGYVIVDSPIPHKKMKEKYKHIELKFSKQFIETGEPTAEDVEKVPIIDKDTENKRRIREKLKKSSPNKKEKK